MIFKDNFIPGGSKGPKTTRNGTGPSPRTLSGHPSEIGQRAGGLDFDASATQAGEAEGGQVGNETPAAEQLEELRSFERLRLDESLELRAGKKRRAAPESVGIRRGKRQGAADEAPHRKTGETDGLPGVFQNSAEWNSLRGNLRVNCFFVLPFIWGHFTERKYVFPSQKIFFLFIY